MQEKSWQKRFVSIKSPMDQNNIKMAYGFLPACGPGNQWTQVFYK